MLFKIKKDVPLFELNPEMAVVEEFAKLTEKQMMVVMLVADYKSPLRSLPERTRREKACITSGYTAEEDRLARNAREVVYGKVKSIEKAIEKYKEIQYDETKESIEAIDKQIDEAIQVMKMDKIEMCRVEKVTTRPDGEQIKTSYIDGIQAVKLIAEAAKLGAKIKELREARIALLETTPKEESTLDITTHTSADLDDYDDEDGMSTLDMVNQKQSNDDKAE